MFSFFVVCGASFAFLICLERLGIVSLSLSVVANSKSALHVIGDANLDDTDKETAIQRMALEMLQHFVKIAGLTIAALSLPAVLIVGMVWLGWTDESTLTDAALSLPFITLNVIAFAAICFWKCRA